MVAKKQQKIALLLDGKAGHENQSKGLLAYFKERYDCQVQIVNARLKLKPLTRKFFTSLINKGLNPAKAGAIVKGYELDGQIHETDIVISAGGDTVFLNLALANHLSATSVFIGSPRKIQLDKYGWLLTLEDYQHDNNIVMPISPMDLDKQMMLEQGSELRQSVVGDKNSIKLIALLVGGNGAGFKYANEDWLVLSENLNKLCSSHGYKLLVTTSRRTGAAVESILRDGLLSKHIADAVWYSDKPRKVMAAYLGAADRVFVTAESMSMISEAISSGKPTVSLEPAKAQPDSKYASAMESFIQKGWLKTVPIRGHKMFDNMDAAQAPTESVQEFWQKTVTTIAEH